MASRYWLGVNNDFTSTSNWSTTRGGSSGSAAPTSSDDVFILDGDGDITTNITGVTAQSIKIGGNFSGNIGGSGTGMTLATTTCPVTIDTIAPGKSIAFGAAASTTVSGILRVRSTGSGTLYLIGGSSGVYTTVRCGRTGRIVVTSSAASVTNLYSAGMNVTAEYSATAFTLLELRRGANGATPHLIRRAATTQNVTNGAVARNTDSVAVTTMNVESGGTVIHDSNGTIGTLNALPLGVLRTQATAFTVTDANIWEGSTTPAEGSRVTYTNTPEFIGDVG